MPDTVYIVVVARNNEYVACYASREKAQHMIDKSGMERGYYYIMAQEPIR